MAPPRDPDSVPEYTIHRTLPRRLALRRAEDGVPPGLGPPRRRRVLRFPGLWRLIGWAAIAAMAWAVLSLVVFLVSAQLQREGVSNAAGAALSDGGSTFTASNVVLVLGSDARTEQTSDPGSQSIGQPSRSDTILLMRVGGGGATRLSIPRDTVVDIPGHGRDKINAAYALGGPELAIKTVRGFLGVPINHVVEVNFANFPAFIDALGGIDLRTGCVVSRISGGFRNGGYTLRLKPGEHHLDGRAALALARTRKNECRPSENDLTRARRQQKILAAIKSRTTSPATFLRGPFVAWAAPKAIRTDMAGPSLLGLFSSMATTGSPPTRVLKPTGQTVLPDGGAGLTVTPNEVRDEVRRFLAP